MTEISVRQYLVFHTKDSQGTKQRRIQSVIRIVAIF